MQTVLLINTNIVRPPVSPVGLEYVAQTLVDAGVSVNVLDFSFEANWQDALQGQLKNDEPLLVGLSVRNTDDCCFVSKKSFLPWIIQVVTEVKKLTEAPVFLGGVGFSIMPETVLQTTRADYGISGDGEEAMLALVEALQKGEYVSHLPNLVYWHGEEVVCNPRVQVDLGRLPKPKRRIFDNVRYEQFGAMVGIETKRGCSQKCIFCADPVAKGRKVRLRPPDIVAKECQDLVGQGVSWLHLCDSEFNLPLEHAKDVCRAIIHGGLGSKIRWYCYCSPVPFDEELACLMKAAGCAGINFGIDSFCDEQLRRLGRAHSSGDVARLVNLIQQEKLNYMCDLLLGGPGETPQTLRETINRAKEGHIPLVGISAGVRVYSRTPLGEKIASGSIREGLYPGVDVDPDQPFFYLSPLLGEDALGLIRQLVGDDPRFLLLSAPAEKGSYNYAGDDVLCQMIERGARGAYWDIIQQSKGV